MKKVLLLILDGFGLSENEKHNAIKQANSPNWDKLLASKPNSKIETSGAAVGLPEGVMGNSEVGHLTIGSGRILKQDLARISDFCQSDSFSQLNDFKRVVEKAGVLHVMGLLSDGGVHSHITHIKKVIDDAKNLNPDKVIVYHAIMDGRDTSPRSGIDFISKLNGITIGTVMGRFYAMDRDQRWERVEKAYKALTSNDVPAYSSASEIVQNSYNSEVFDEFIEPARVEGVERIKPEDQVIFCNFRADRAREIARALTGFDFQEFDNQVKVPEQDYLTFTQYQKSFQFPVLFPKEYPNKTLGELISAKGLKQFRVAETEKYAHVTYFFNGGVEKEFDGEDRVLIESPKDVKTYDEKPEMSVFEVTDEIIKAMEKDYTVIISNFANGDMVGHTGNQAAAIKAVEAMDKCIGNILVAAKKHGVDVFITADHGNCEEMVSDKGEALTQHTTNPVPLVLNCHQENPYTLVDGGLSDIAPTLIDFLGWEKPDIMSGKSLLTH